MGFMVVVLVLVDDVVILDELASDLFDWFAIVLGIEGHGLLDWIVLLCDVVVWILMSGGVDLFNVVVVSVVVFWVLC